MIREENTRKTVSFTMHCYPGVAGSARRLPGEIPSESSRRGGIKEMHEEKEMATHSSILAWKNAWTEESGRLKSMGLHD